jgi:NitT/TauT family transport system permease protein
VTLDIEGGPPRSAAARRGTMTAAAIPGMPPLLACVALLLAWDMIARLIAIDSLPSPWSALKELPELLSDREALFNILDSMRRMATGFVLAVLFSIPLGLVMGRSRMVAAFFNPLMMVIYPVPKAALMPIIMLWLGVGEAAKILVIFLGVSLPVIYHSHQGGRAVEEKMLWSAAAMGMGAGARLLRIVLPAALPEIMIGARTGLVLALITMVTSEMIARQSGVGNILFNALDMAQYQSVYATIVVIGLIGFVLDVAFEKLRGVLLTWAEPAFPIVAGST